MKATNSRFFLTDKLDYINMECPDFERVIKGEKPERKYKQALPKETVLAIYNSKENSKSLSQLYEVSTDVINKIKRKERYKSYFDDN